MAPTPREQLHSEFGELGRRFFRAAEAQDSRQIRQTMFPLVREGGILLVRAIKDGVLPDRSGLLAYTNGRLEEDRKRATIPSHRRAKPHDTESPGDPYCSMFSLYADNYLKGEVQLPPDGLSAFSNLGCDESQTRALLIERAQAYGQCCKLLSEWALDNDPSKIDGSGKILIADLPPAMQAVILELLSLLATKADRMNFPVEQLPQHLQDADVLALCEERQLVEFTACQDTSFIFANGERKERWTRTSREWAGLGGALQSALRASSKRTRLQERLHVRMSEKGGVFLAHRSAEQWQAQASAAPGGTRDSAFLPDGFQESPSIAGETQAEAREPLPEGHAVGSDPFVLRDKHLTVLLELSEEHAPVTAATLASRSGMPAYDLLTELLKELERWGLVDRPHGRKSGYRLLAAGREELKKRDLLK